MVTKGQYLERPTLIPLGRQVLEGLSHRGKLAPAVLVVPPTPAEGSSMDHVLAAQIAWACATSGHPTLRFNFGGVGASQGARGSGDALVDEAQAALTVLEENVAGSPAQGPVAVIAIAGSFEVAAALATRKGLAGVCLVAAPAAASGRRFDVPSRVVADEGNLLTLHLTQTGNAVVEWLQTLGREAERR
jgi:alpha/beta superfamily hydrolase